MSRSDVRNEEEVNASATAFVEKCREHFDNFPADCVLNTDQSGFNLEMLFGRTLEQKGTKIVESRINQPTLSAAGRLITPLFIVLQEQGGVFGPIVSRNMFKHKEILVMPTTSGKVTKDIMKAWFLQVYFPNVANNSCLLVDAFTTYRDRQAIDLEKPPTSTYAVEVIPKGTTGMVQPLDVYFFRLYKNFVKKIGTHMSKPSGRGDASTR